MSCLLHKWQKNKKQKQNKDTKAGKSTKRRRSSRKELELVIKKKAFSIETVKDKLLRFYTGFENYEQLDIENYELPPTASGWLAITMIFLTNY